MHKTYTKRTQIIESLSHWVIDIYTVFGISFQTWTPASGKPPPFLRVSLADGDASSSSWRCGFQDLKQQLCVSLTTWHLRCSKFVFFQKHWEMVSVFDFQMACKNVRPEAVNETIFGLGTWDIPVEKPDLFGISEQKPIMWWMLADFDGQTTSFFYKTFRRLATCSLHSLRRQKPTRSWPFWPRRFGLRRRLWTLWACRDGRRLAVWKKPGGLEMATVQGGNSNHGFKLQWKHPHSGKKFRFPR